jgi:hypothetical protein
MFHKNIKWYLPGIIFAISAVAICYSQSAPPVPAVEGIDWVNRVVVAKGIGSPNPTFSQAQQRPAAIRAAKQLALRNALELVKGCPLNSETTVENFMVTNDVVRTQVSGFIRNFNYEPNPHYMSDGTVEIMVSIPLDGIDGLGNSLFGGQSSVLPAAPGAIAMAPSGTPVTVFTGLILDCKGLGIKPALAPKVVDEDGNEIYGSAYVSKDFAVKFGMAGYAKTVQNAMGFKDRIGATPGVLKGLKAAGANKCDVVIANKDALSLKSAKENLKFFSECRVIIILD